MLRNQEEVSGSRSAFRVNAIQQLDRIATVLGPERTNSELLPYIMGKDLFYHCLEMIDDEDEVLLELAKVLGNFLPHIGGKSNVVNLLKPLEALCTVEEGAVRETAAKGINKLLSSIKVKDFEEDLVTLFSRLVKGDWFTSKISATMILPAIYPHVSSHGQKQLFKLFAPL